MTIVLNGTTGITNDGGYTGDGISFADTTPANTLVTTTGGNVGIGTSSPATKLDVNGSVRLPDGYEVGFGSANTTYWLGDSTNNWHRFYTSNTERMRIDSSGNLLVGNTNGANARINVVADSNNVAFFRNSGGTGLYLVSGQTSWTTASDERVKTSLTPFENAVDKVCFLRAGTGRYLTDDESVSRSFLIAQDVQAVLPEAVNVQDDEQGTLGLQYTDLIPLLTAAIQEQQAIITDLKSRIETLEAK